MSDAQDESAAEQATTAAEVIEKDALVDDVVEERPVTRKKSGFIGLVIALVLLGGVAGAGWYYQGMWLPQAQQAFQLGQAWVQDLASSEEDGRDLMAAPALRVEPEETDSESNDVAAMKEPEVVAAKQIPRVEAENTRAVDEPIVNSAAADKQQTEMETTPLVSAEPVVTESTSALAENESAQNKEMETTPLVSAEPVATESTAVLADNESVQSKEMDIIAVTENPETKVMPEITQVMSESTKAVINLNEARQAFWQRDFPKAESLYKEQLKHSQVNADSWGELGNIYYLQAKWQQAAMAYTEAALILLDKGNFPQAMFIRYIVVGLDPVQARRIDEHVKALQAPLHG